MDQFSRFSLRKVFAEYAFDLGLDWFEKPYKTPEAHLIYRFAIYLCTPKREWILSSKEMRECNLLMEIMRRTLGYHIHYFGDDVYIKSDVQCDDDSDEIKPIGEIISDEDCESSKCPNAGLNVGKFKSHKQDMIDYARQILMSVMSMLNREPNFWVLPNIQGRIAHRRWVTYLSLQLAGLTSDVAHHILEFTTYQTGIKEVKLPGFQDLHFRPRTLLTTNFAKNFLFRLHTSASCVVMDHYAATFTDVVRVLTGKKVPEGDGLGFRRAMDAKAVYAWGLVNTMLDNPRVRRRAFMEYLYEHLSNSFTLLHYTTFLGMYGALESCPTVEDCMFVLSELRKAHVSKLAFESRLIGVITQDESDIRKIKGDNDYSRRYRRNLYNLMT
jgi:hypothetical protein